MPHNHYSSDETCNIWPPQLFHHRFVHSVTVEDADLPYPSVRLLTRLLSNAQGNRNCTIIPNEKEKRTYTFKLRNELNDQQKKVIESVLLGDGYYNVSTQWLRI